MINSQQAKHLAITAEQQQAITPQQVLTNLMDGNERYVNGAISDPNIKANIATTSQSQHPSAVILSCLDSRVIVENVFDQGIGDIFVARVAGNIENNDILGSFEFATKLAGAKLILVLGHEACGAVKGACDHAELGNLTTLLEKIQPAINAVKDQFSETDRNSSNLNFVNQAAKENVRITINNIRKKSPILAEMETNGEINIIGAYYSLQTGKVTLLS